MALLQNFSVTRNNDEPLSVSLETVLPGETLVGATVQWAVYGMSFGEPLPSPVLIHKTSEDDGITIPGSPDLFFVINLLPGDTFSLEPGNYYHEALVTDDLGHRSTVMYGAMAVTNEVLEI